ncbi:MAG: sulfatase-like hydrolase/transferase [Gammaproteobacteria bacterium]|nr:sulfatase-like hydrolase/transferase [Gammaproteobacteria bacterium]MBU1655754.1 sulfatase-like hydrolase/transferase [Gammaproteobacteria bacterium]MBU1959931.1 sulfatase-like hydrolase/transferase [Gammaproteobacteria bacterium]
MSHPEGDSALADIRLASPLDVEAGLPWPSPGEILGLGLSLYRATRIYLAFSLWFVLIWWLGEYVDFKGHIDVFHIEFPFCLYLFFTFNQILRPSRWRPLLAALPIFGLYAVHDSYLFLFGEVPALAQLNELPELFLVGDFWLRTGLILTLLGTAWCALRCMEYNRRSLLAALPLLGLGIALVASPALVINGMDAGRLRLNTWLQSENAARNGRLTLAVYNEARRQLALSGLESHAGNESQRQYYNQVLGYLREHARRDRQVFVILLESFLDPRLLEPYKERDEYLAPNFRRRYDKALGLSVSPMFGGGTPQAEFEVLCGLPAFAEFNKVEFNLFAGNPIPCLPQVLSELGYDTLANDPYIPAFFNVNRAYPGMGFTETYFAREHTDLPTYLRLERGYKYLFDGALYDQNRDFLEQRQSRKPLFNYLLTLYGHLYFDVQRPIKWKVKSKEAFLEKIVNISYYRSGPLAEYLEWINRHYPKSLVIALADHLPFLGGGPERYKALGYLHNTKDSVYHNRVLVIQDGKPRKLPTIHHFGVPYLVYDYLTDGGFCENFECPIAYPYDKEQLRERYHYLMANAVQRKSLE